MRACKVAALRAAEIMIAMAPETSRAQMNLERPKLVQSMIDQCIAQGWSEDALRCLTNAKDYTGLQRCQSLILPSAGSGSGAVP
jgi:hypothetical protein